MKLSYSSVSTYDQCPKKWEFKYVHKMKERARHYFSFGKAVHAALEFMYEADACPTAAEVVGAFLAAWSDAGYKDEAAIRKGKRDGESMLVAYHARHAKSWAEPLALEAAFDMAVGHVRMKGFVDRVDVMPDGKLHIIDYKTGRELEPDRISTDEQMTTYQMAAEHMWPESPVGKLSLVHVPTSTWHTAPARDAAVVERQRDKVLDVAARIAVKDFAPKPSEEACAFCDFKKECPAWL